MADLTAVGKHLSVGGDASPDAVTGYDYVVLVAAERQHVGESYGPTVIRCPLPDDDEPSTATVEKAQACASKVAFLIAPFSVPYEIWQKYMPRGAEIPGPMGKDPDLIVEYRVLVTCLEGENRSLFVAGMALVLSGEQPDGRAAREYLETLRGSQSFQSPGYRKALDKFYPKELLAYRAPQKPVTSRGVRLG